MEKQGSDLNMREVYLTMKKIQERKKKYKRSKIKCRYCRFLKDETDYFICPTVPCYKCTVTGECFFYAEADKHTKCEFYVNEEECDL